MEINAQKQKAIECLKTLNVYKPYIEAFRRSGRVCFFERFGGYYVDQEPEIEKKMKEIEEKSNCLVYAITHEYLEFGECYDFLIVTREPDEWNDLVMDYEGGKIAFAYVWNKDADDCSEFGDICIKSFGGGIKRIA